MFVKERLRDYASELGCELFLRNLNTLGGLAYGAAVAAGNALPRDQVLCPNGLEQNPRPDKILKPASHELCKRFLTLSFSLELCVLLTQETLFGCCGSPMA